MSAALWAAGRGLPAEVVARQRIGPTGVDLTTDALLRWDGCDADIRAGIAQPQTQWLVVTGERGAIELRDSPFTAGPTDETELWVSDGWGTRRLPVPAAAQYRIMLEELSSVLRGGPGWVLPVAESRQTAAVLDACLVSAREGGVPVRPG